MAGKESKILYRRLLRSYFSSVISISLVLFLVGMTGALIVNAKSVSNYFKENIAVSAVLNVEADEADASALADSLERTSYIKNVRIITKAEGVEEMKEEALYGYPAVDDVVYQQSLVELLNANIERIGIVTGVFVALLLFISVVLISNTVRLSVEPKRSTIRVMRLVGATKGFITRPFAGQAFFQGLIAGAVADIFILTALYFVRNEFYQLFSLFDAMLLGLVMAVVIVLGILICMISTVVGVRSLINDEDDFNNK